MMVFEHTTPTLLIWGALLAALAAGAFSVWRFAPRSAAVAAISALYAGFLLLLTWCLLIPGRKTVESRMLKPRFVIALDTSRSMLLSPSDAVSNRWTAARNILSLDWTRVVAAECEVDVYPFDSDTRGRMALEDANGLEPDGEATGLRDALRRITGRYAGINVAGGLLLSDGIDTREAFEDWAAETRPFPIHTVRLEPQGEWEIEPDLRVNGVQTPRRVTVDWRTELIAVVSGQGARDQAVNVQLYKDGVLSQEAPARIPSDGGSAQVRFDLAHPEIGVFTYRVFAPPLRGESNTNDNDYVASIQVVDAKNRLIYVEGPPRWESKYLKRALQASEQITPLIFVQGPGGRPLSFGPVGNLTADLTERELAFFKIVVLGNLDARELGAERARNLVRFVETGGSLILLGGTEAWSRDGFAASPLKQVLPVKSFKPAPDEGEFPVMLAEAGRTHAAFGGDSELWEIIPPVLSVFPDVVPAPAAQALVTAETPRGSQPIIVSQRYGQGKVVAIFTDSLWKWQLHPDAVETRPYQRFWDQVIAWMLPEEEDVAADRLDLFADRESMVLGEKITISARMGGRREVKDAEVKCEIELPDGTGAPFAMRSDVVTTSSGKAYPGYSTTYEAALPGLHKVVATASFDGRQAVSEPVSFFVKPFSAESIPRPLNAAVLKAIAQGSRGRFFDDPDELNKALSRLTFRQVEEQSSEYSSLWQTPGVIACLIALATLSWIVRKMNSMP